MDKEFTIYTKINKTVFKQFSFFNSFVLDDKYRSIVVFPIAMALVGIFFLVKQDYGFATTVLMLGSVFSLGYYLLYQKGIKQQVEKFKLESDVPVYTLQCDKNGVSIFNDKEKTRFLWNEIDRLYIYKENYYLYVTPQKAFVMPFKDVTGGSPAELLEFFKEVMPAEKIVSKG